MSNGKFKKSPFGKIAIALGKGILKEAVSYVPIVGDNLANVVENSLPVIEVRNPKVERIAEIIGKCVPWIIGGLLLAFGVIDFDQFQEVTEDAK